MKTTFQINEPIGYEWRDEWIWLPGSGGRVVNADTGEALPSQVSGSQMCVRVNLKPDEKLSLRVEPGNANFGSPFAISQQEISNGLIAVKLPATNAFDPGNAPGPVVAIERAGQWIGQGIWGTCEVTGRVETTITDRGPLFARWVVRYLIGARLYARYECTLYAGEDFVQVRDETLLGAKMTFRFRLIGADAPTEWFTYGGGVGDVLRGPMSDPPARKGLDRPGEFSHIDFNSGHFQASYTWFGFKVRGDSAVGITELRGGHWKIPGRNRIRSMRVDDGLELVVPSDGGGKDFALACGDYAAYAPQKGLSRLCHVRRKYGDIPLEKVRHWVTEWPLQRYDRPITFPRGTVEHWRQKLDAWPELAAAWRENKVETPAPRLVQYLVRNDPAIRDGLIKQASHYMDEAIKHVLQDCYLRLIIFDGRWIKGTLEVIDVLRWLGELDEATARSFARRMAFLAYCFADRDFWPWDSAFRERDDPRSLGAEYWDDVGGGSTCPPNFYSEYYSSFGLFGLTYPEHPESNRWVDQATDLLERKLAFNYYDNGGYDESCLYFAFELGILTPFTVGLLAAGGRDFFEHPRFKKTFGFFIDMLTPRIALTDAGVETCGPAVSPHYHSNLNPTRDGRAVLLTNWGNSGHDCGGYVVPFVIAVAAGIYADRDREYAQRLMTAWRASAQEYCIYFMALHLVALGRPDLKDAPLKLESKLIESLGAVMRAGDTFAWIKCGTASNHLCRDEGGLVLYAGGAPIIGDFGYHTKHEGRQEGGSDTWKHACVTFNGRTTLAYHGSENRMPPKLWRRTPQADLLVCDLSVDYIIGDGAKYYLDVERVPRIEHTRQILFVKPHYFIIYDQIPKSTRPSTWWLHALADEVTIEGQHVRFRGRFGMDLDVQIVQPGHARVEQGVYSVQRHIRIDQPGAGDYLVVLMPLPRDGIGPRTRWDEASRLLQVEYAGRADRIAIDPRELHLVP